ncbi:hypothetical protein LEP1GSC126_0427 [Leptospira kirschneri str. 200801774]|nr:hypothetical protein LEP1GSC126_0427 [Leptospira kirschneri str. 200801774]
MEFGSILGLKKNESFSFFSISVLIEICPRFFILDLIEL